MPLRGESIGTAYVRVLADASGFPDSLRDEIDRDEPGIKRQGKHYAQAFEEGFQEEVERGDDLNLRAVLNRALGSNEATQQFFGGKEWDRVKTRIKNEFGNVGELAAHELEEKFVNSGSLRGLDDDVENIIRRISSSTARIAKTQEDEARAAQKAMSDFEKDFRRVMQETDDLSKKVSSDNVSNLERVRRTFEGIASSVRKLHTEFGRSGEDAVRYVKTLRTTDRDSATIFGRLGKEVDGMTSRVGRLFGKGSRNDFLNFVGSFVQGTTSLIGIPLKIADNMGQFVNGFREALSVGEGFFSAMRSGFTEMAKDSEGAATTLSTSFTTLLVSLPVLAATLGGILLILGPVASLISGIAAAVVGLAGSIAFGLVGAIAPLAAALVPLGAGIAVIVASIATLNKKDSKELISTISTLKKEVSGLGGAFADAFGNSFHEDITETIFRLDMLKPLFREVGQAAGQISNEFVKGLRSAAFDRFLIYLQRQVPFALKSASTAVGNLFAGVGQVLIDIVPQTRVFFSWLDKITADFKNFVTQNPDKVRQFFRDAAESTKAIGRFLGGALDLLGQLLSKGKGTGDSIFTSLGDNLSKFSDFLSKNPDALKDWFTNGKATADELGQIVIGVGQLFSALDSNNSRKSLANVLDIADALGKLAYPLSLAGAASFQSLNALGALFGSFKSIAKSNALSAVAHAFDDVAKAVAKIGDIHLPNLNLGKKIGDFFSSLGSGKGGAGVGTLTIKPPSLAWMPGILKRVQGFFGDITHAANIVDFSALGSKARSAASAVGRFFAAIPGKLSALTNAIGSAASGWGAEILNRISGVPGQIIHYFAGLGGRIADAIGSISLHFDFPSPPGWLSKLGPAGGLLNSLKSASGGLFDGAQLRIIGEAGPEAVVPLSGPLSAVDPSVRWLAELARGQGVSTLGATAAGKTINNEWHIVSTNPDVTGIANSLLDRMATTGY